MHMKYLVKITVLTLIFFSLQSQGQDTRKNGEVSKSKPEVTAPKGAVVDTDKNGNTTINSGKGNQVSNESGTVDGKKWINTKKPDSVKGDSDEAFWGKGGFWGNGGSAP